jgi:hypothetical protein
MDNTVVKVATGKWVLHNSNSVNNIVCNINFCCIWNTVVLKYVRTEVKWCPLIFVHFSVFVFVFAVMTTTPVLITEDGYSMSGALQSHLQDLRKRITALEHKVHNPLDCSIIEIDEQIRRARHAVEFTYRCYSAQWKWVPSDYYSLPLTCRAKILNACNVPQLCKSILMENKKFLADEVAKENASRAYSRFYLVVVQYTSTISTKKLELAIRKLRKVGEGRLPANCFEFSVAKEVRIGKNGYKF